MKKSILFTLAATAFCLNLNAGKASFSGEGTASASPEFVVVNIQVASQCYATPSAANAANNATVKNIQQFLKEFLDPDCTLDKVSIQGGWTHPYSKSVYENGVSRTVCDNTFQQSTDISFKTGNLSEFSATFAAIQEKVLGEFNRSNEDLEEAVTFASISTPNANVCENTRAKMKKEALSKACGNARCQFDTMANACKITGNVEVCSVTNNDERVYKSSGRYEAALSSGSSSIELNFDDLSESASVTIEYAYQPTFFAVCSEE